MIGSKYDQKIMDNYLAIIQCRNCKTTYNLDYVFCRTNSTLIILDIYSECCDKPDWLWGYEYHEFSKIPHHVLLMLSSLIPRTLNWFYYKKELSMEAIRGSVIDKDFEYKRMLTSTPYIVRTDKRREI